MDAAEPAVRLAHQNWHWDKQQAAMNPAQRWRCACVTRVGPVLDPQWNRQWPPRHSRRQVCRIEPRHSISRSHKTPCSVAPQVSHWREWRCCSCVTSQTLLRTYSSAFRGGMATRPVAETQPLFYSFGFACSGITEAVKRPRRDPNLSLTSCVFSNLSP